MIINNETIGISCEVAIAEYFNLKMNEQYRKRGNREIIEKVKIVIPEIFSKFHIPFPIEHTAEDHCPYDFLLKENKTLSVKSNKNKLGKVAPSNIGQPSSNTFFKKFSMFFKDENIQNYTYEEKRELFKNFVINNISFLVEKYYDNLFETDYYIHFYNFNNNDIKYIVLEREYIKNFNLKNIDYTFTRDRETWNESTTLKISDISVGEFQVHKNRDCFKFRFNIDNLLKIMEKIENGYL